MFCDIETAERIEASERALVRAGAERVAARRPDAGTFVVPCASGLAVYADTGSPLNKIVGAGMRRGFDENELATAEEAFFSQGVPVQAEVSSLAPHDLGEALTRRGYALTGFENLLGMPLTPRSEPAQHGVDISEVDEANADVWIATLTDGFLAPDGSGVESHESYDRGALKRVFADFIGVPGFVPLLAMIDGAPAGASGVRLHEGVATLCGTATLREKRRRGVQSALLSHRLALAAREGCDLAIVTTQPGSASMANAVRAGFTLLYARAILVREPPER